MIYLDSCLVIYLVEPDNAYEATLRARLDADSAETFAVSPLVVMECLVRPRASGDMSLRHRYERFLDSITMLPFDRMVFERAAALRAEHRLKTPDALHLAVALNGGCDELWTNDLRLQRAAGPFARAVVGVSDRDEQP